MGSNFEEVVENFLQKLSENFEPILGKLEDTSGTCCAEFLMKFC